MVQPGRWKDRPHADQRFAVYYFVNSCRHPYLKLSLKQKFEVYRPVTVYVIIFWDVTPCSTGVQRSLVPSSSGLFIIFIWNVFSHLPCNTASLSGRVFFRSRNCTTTSVVHLGSTEYEDVWSYVEVIQNSAVKLLFPYCMQSDTN